MVLLAILDILRLTSFHYLLLSPHGILPVRVSKIPLFYKDTSHWIRAHLNLVWPRFNFTTSTKDLFPTEVTFIGAGA